MTCSLLLNNQEIVSYADDNTPYVTCDTIESMTASLEKIAKEIFKLRLKFLLKIVYISEFFFFFLNITALLSLKNTKCLI